jgi:general secretion pathway protein G
MLEAALDASRADTGRIPTRGEGLRARVNAPPGTAGWKGPYIKRGVPNDPWGHPYVYHPGGGNGCRVLSVGPDATEGTADDVRP